MTDQNQTKNLLEQHSIPTPTRKQCKEIKAKFPASLFVKVKEQGIDEDTLVQIDDAKSGILGILGVEESIDNLPNDEAEAVITQILAVVYGGVRPGSVPNPS